MISEAWGWEAIKHWKDSEQMKPALMQNAEIGQCSYFKIKKIIHF